MYKEELSNDLIAEVLDVYGKAVMNTDYFNSGTINYTQECNFKKEEYNSNIIFLGAKIKLKKSIKLIRITGGFEFADGYEKDENVYWRIKGSIDGYKFVNISLPCNEKYKYFIIEQIWYNRTFYYKRGKVSEIKMYHIDTEKKYLLKQNSQYYSIKSNFYELGHPINNTQLGQWYKKYGAKDINISTQKLSIREMPMTLDEVTGIWKTDFELDASNITDNIELLENDNEKSNYKIIKYESPQYRIYDLLDNEFEIMMLE